MAVVVDQSAALKWDWKRFYNSILRMALFKSTFLSDSSLIYQKNAADSIHIFFSVSVFLDRIDDNWTHSKEKDFMH